MNVNPTKTAELNKKLFEIQETMFQRNDLQFFKDLEELIDKYNVMVKQTFVVGKVFQDRDATAIIQRYGYGFNEHFILPSKHRVITIDFSSGMKVKKLDMPKFSHSLDSKEYNASLRQQFNETVVQTAMSLEEFWMTLYCLIIEPHLGSKHLHFKLELFTHYFFAVKDDSSDQKLVHIHYERGWGLSRSTADPARHDRFFSYLYLKRS